MEKPETTLEAAAPADEHLIRPFAALRPVADRAAEVASPPYDVVTTAEARALARGNPYSFLHVSRAEIDLPEGTDPYADAVYAKARANMQRLVGEGVLRRDPEPAYYVYRLTMGEHVQTGVVAAASIGAYESGRIRRHELTRPAKEDDRVRQIEAVNAQTGPVLTVHRANAAVSDVVREVCANAPETHVTADDGVEHSIWPIVEPDRIRRLTEAFDAMEALYIADGHHRSAAAARVAKARATANPRHRGDEPYTSCLIVSFPDDEVRILDYNRVVRDLAGLSAEAFRQRIAERFTVEPSGEPVRPARPHQFGLYLEGRWYRLDLRDSLPGKDKPVARLDVSLLAERLLGPVLGIGDPRSDRRIDFVGGTRGLEELERRVDSGEMAAAFSLYPTALADLMAVADAGEVMPPKSTWFEPKLADGLVSLVLD